MAAIAQTFEHRPGAALATTTPGTTRMELTCGICGYGAVVARLPERCPMCAMGNAHAWIRVERRRP
jgi:rubrerythrin